MAEPRWALGLQFAISLVFVPPSARRSPIRSNRSCILGSDVRPWLVWPKLRYLPLAIGASVLVIPWICLPWSLVTREWTQPNEKEIAGAVHETVPTLSLNTVLNTSYQRWMARLIGRLSPIFTPAVRWKNQLYYTLMGTAGSDRVVVGNHHQLLELSYMVEYCSRDLGQLRTKGEAWALGIRRIRDFFHGKG